MNGILYSPDPFPEPSRVVWPPKRFSCCCCCQSWLFNWTSWSVPVVYQLTFFNFVIVFMLCDPVRTEFEWTPWCFRSCGFTKAAMANLSNPFGMKIVHILYTRPCLLSINHDLLPGSSFIHSSSSITSVCVCGWQDSTSPLTDEGCPSKV